MLLLSTGLVQQGRTNGISPWHAPRDLIFKGAVCHIVR
jgi:hypothetical protein